MSFLNDPIKIVCRFQGGKVTPLSFEWHQRPYKIERIVFRFQTNQGTEPLLIFSCETTEGVFDLSFNLKTLSWRIRSFHQEA